MKLANFRIAMFLSSIVLMCIFSVARANTVTGIEVQVTGVSGELLNNVRAYLQIANLDDDRSYRPDQIRYLHRKASSEIKQALQPFGYYNVSVNSSIKPADGRWQATYQVVLNQPVTINQNDWQLVGAGSDDRQLQRLIEQSDIAKGQALRHRQYEQLKTALLSTAVRSGYHHARFQKARVVVDTEQLTAAIHVIFDTGPQFYFGELTITASHLNDDLIARYPRFDTGEPLLMSKLSEFQVDLGNSEYFSQVQVSPDWEAATDEHYVPIMVETTANQQTQYRYGIGYGTDTGARLTFGLNRRWVNERGHQFRSQLQLSQYESTATAIYHIPGLKPQMDYHQLRTELGDKENDSQNSRLYKVAALDVFTYDQWQREYKLSWLQEDFTIGQQKDSSQFFVPAMIWRRLSAGQRMNVDNGWRLNLGLSAAADSVLSDTNMLRAYAEFKSVWSFADNWRLLNRVELGGMYTDNFYLLPPSLRFFAGGDNSVRGYAYEQLGPEDESGAVIGGQYVAVASAEIDYRFADNWRVAAFTDIGNSMLEPNQPLKQSIGIGLRWIAPIGSIRLDVAQAIDEPGKPWRLHFTLGPDL